MVIPGFAYHRPRTIEEACGLAASLDGTCRFLAGGTELIPELKRGRASAAHVISLRDVKGLREIRADGDALRIGAAVSHEAVARSSVVMAAYPALAGAAGSVGCVQIREQGTIGGNFCGAVPCADTPPVCVAAGAMLTIVGPDGVRSIPAGELIIGPRETSLAAGEMLTEIVLPYPVLPSDGLSYMRFGLRKGMAVAVASVAAGLRISEGLVDVARVVLGAVAPVPLLVPECAEVLEGGAPSDENIERAAGIASERARPICDIRGTDEYRREIVRVLARRALKEALSRVVEGAA